MKKVLISMLALLIMGNAYADDRFSVDDITLPQNSVAPLAVKYVWTRVTSAQASPSG